MISILVLPTYIICFEDVKREDSGMKIARFLARSGVANHVV